MVAPPPPNPRGLTNGLVLERSKPHRTGMTNGVEGRTNGRHGRTNGLDTGLGRTNGLTNGVGRTNGLADRSGRSNRRRNTVGFTNGLSLRTNTFGIVASSDVRRTATLIALSIVVMLLVAYVLGVPPTPRSPFVVDGNFSEWSTVPLYTYDTDSAQSSGDFVAYAFHAEPNRLSVYGKTVGPLFGGSQPSVVYLEIDNPARVGYSISGFDADYLAEFWGWDNALKGDTLRSWSGAADRDNASALWSVATFPVAVVGNQFEMALDESGIDFTTIPNLRVRLASEFANQLDHGAPVGLSPGSLIVTQTSRAGIVSSTIALLEIRMRALMADVQVSGIAVNRSGGGSLVMPGLPITVPAGQELTVQVGVDVSALPVGTFVAFDVFGVTAKAVVGGYDVPLTILGHGVRTYVQARPAGHIVDGLFDDWSLTSPDPVDPVRASIDLRASAFAADTDPFFYVRTGGDVMLGTIVPERRVPLIPPPSGSSPLTPQPRRAGEDFLQIFVESGVQPAVGPTVGGINADHLIELNGRAGRITSRAAFAWNDTTWKWEPRSDPFKVAFVGTELEASVAASFFTPTNASRAVFAMSDWAGNQDRTDAPIPKSAPSLMAAVSPSHAPLPDNITATPLVNTPTVDGVCGTTGGEYNGASIGTNAFLTFAIGSRDDTQDIYACVRVTADITRNNNDWGELIFDTLHNGGTAPQTDDKLFWLFGNGDNVLKAWQGNGLFWDTTCPACDPGNIGRSRWSGTNEVYEFRIKYKDVWNTSKPAANQVAGFAIIIYDFSPNVLYTWGGNAVNENIPDSWGHVFYPIPEFPTMVLVVAVVLLLPIVRWRRAGARAVRKSGPVRSISVSAAAVAVPELYRK